MRRIRLFVLIPLLLMGALAHGSTWRRGKDIVRDRAPTSDQPTTPHKLYKWTDREGRIHITDTPPLDPRGKGQATGSD